MPWTTPGTPWPTAAPPAGSTPTSRVVSVDEPGEQPDRVRAAADAGDHHVGVATGDRPALLARLVADHPVELAHHPWIRVRAHHRPEAVVRVADRRHPIAQCLVDGVLQRARTAVHGFDVGAQQPHPEHVERLAVDVDGAHVDLALETHQRRRRGGGHAVLAGTGLGDQPGLAHPLGEQRLAEHVVDLVRTGVVEVLTLEQHANAELLAQPEALGEHRGAPGVVAQDRVELAAEAGVGPCGRGSPPRAPGTPGSASPGTNRPPNSPNRPVASGSVIIDSASKRSGSLISGSLVGPVVRQLVGPEVGLRVRRRGR